MLHSAYASPVSSRKLILRKQELSSRLSVFALILGASGLLVFGTGCPEIFPPVPSPRPLPRINHDPTADAGADQNVDVGARVLLDGFSTDPDGDPLTYQWERRSGPSVALDGVNSPQASFVPATSGVYEFALTVTDDHGGSDDDTVLIFVGDGPNPTCPTADAGIDQTVNEGSAVTLRGGNSADPSGNPLRYDWFQLSGDQVSINGRFNAEPSFVAPQMTGADIELAFKLTVANDQGCSDTDTVVITVQDRGSEDPCRDLVCDDGLFCTGIESCEEGICRSSGNPCQPNEFCNEMNHSCDACSQDFDCDDIDPCTVDTCVNGICSNTALDCDDGDLCTNDTCMNGVCSNTLVDCDDGLFCNGTETCDPITGNCIDGDNPCAEGETCDEDTDECPVTQCQLAGQQCPVDFEQQNGMAVIAHGPGACENTGTEPGPSFESFNASLPATVSPGQSTTFSVDWNRCSDCNPNAVIYSSFIGDWDIDQPLRVSGAYFTTCQQTATDSVTFTAPTQPGIYRVRWIMCFAFDAIRNFCGEALTGNSSDPGTCPYVERTFTVLGCGGSLQIVKQRQVETGGFASGIAVSPDESKLYVAYWEDENSSRVQEFSLPALDLLQTFTFGGYHTHGDVVVSGDGTRIFTTNYYYASISQVDLANGNLQTDLSTVDTWPAGISITPNKAKVLATVGQDGRGYDMGNDSIAIYDVSSGAFSLLASVVLEDEPQGTSPIGVSEDSGFAYVGTRKRQSTNPKLYEISLETPYNITRTMEFSEAPLVIGPTRCLGNRVFISDTANPTLWVVDRTSWTKTGYALESAPESLEVHPSGAYLFATMPDIGSIVAIDVASMNIVARYDGLSSAAYDIEFNNDGTKMYVAHRSSVGEIMVFDLSW